jgi:hypothetical protein
MLADPPVEHHEAPDHWIPLRSIFVAIPEVQEAFRAELISRLRHIFGDDLAPLLQIDAGRWLLQFGRWNLSLGELPHYGGTTPIPPPYFEEREGREEVSEAVGIARSKGYGQMALLIRDSGYRVHARSGTADSDFRHVPRDVWLGSWPEDSWSAAITEAGSRLFNVHIERVIAQPVMKQPDVLFKDWFRARIQASPYKPTMKLSKGFELYERALAFGVAERQIERLKREVFQEIPTDFVKAWRKPGSSPSRK